MAIKFGSEREGIDNSEAQVLTPQNVGKVLSYMDVHRNGSTGSLQLKHFLLDQKIKDMKMTGDEGSILITHIEKTRGEPLANLLNVLEETDRDLYENVSKVFFSSV